MGILRYSNSPLKSTDFILIQELKFIWISTKVHLRYLRRHQDVQETSKSRKERAENRVASKIQ